MSFENIKNYNTQQQAAIEHLKGPCLVCAGPGSGKTTVIVNRVLNLIYKHRVNPANILVITYTKAAAEEMKSRFHELAAYNGHRANVSFGTFHSVFYRVLRERYHYGLNNIISDYEKQNALRNIIRTLGLVNYEDAEVLKGLINDISSLKSSVDKGSFQPVSMAAEDFKRVYGCYENYKQDCHKIDFDDMLEKCYGLLLEEENVLNGLRRQYQYILIDEFQDINEIQFAIVKMLTHPLNNIFVVGDDDQSIYSFRGARPEFILDFTKEFPKAEKIIISNNYRSQEKIISAANLLIENNSSRIEKSIAATKPPLEDIRLIYPENRGEENRQIVELINNCIQNGCSYRDIAIVYRTNLLANSIINSLLESQIPFQCRDHISNIYEHWAVEDILSYLKLAVTGDNPHLLASIINKPTRYISRKMAEAAHGPEGCSFTNIMMKGELKPYQLKRLIQLRQDLSILKSKSSYEAIAYIRREIGYDKHIEDYCVEKQLSSVDLFEVLDEIQELALKYDKIQDFIDCVNSFKLRLKQHKAAKSNDNEVLLTTMHSAKGLEFRVVIVIGAVEGLIPHYKSEANDETLEEERRLFYVAVTRAKELLVISSPRFRYDKKAEISRFVDEMALRERLSGNISKGQEILHRAFGKGIVEMIKDRIMTVRFIKGDQIKELDIEICVNNGLIEKL